MYNSKKNINATRLAKHAALPIAAALAFPTDMVSPGLQIKKELAAVVEPIQTSLINIDTSAGSALSISIRVEQPVKEWTKGLEKEFRSLLHKKVQGTLEV